MTIIVIFGVSLFLAIAILILKFWELRSGKRNVFLSFTSPLDKTTVRLTDIFKTEAVKFVARVQRIVLVRSKILAQSLSEKLLNKILKAYNERREIIMGRKEIQNRGSVSFYLRKIDEARQNGRGEIN